MFRKSCSVLGRGESCGLFKLPHKVHIIFISALFGNIADRQRRIHEKLFRIFDSGMNNISFAGNAKILFIEMLKVGRTEANLVSEIGNIPFKVWPCIDFGTKQRKFVIVVSFYLYLTLRDLLGDLIEKNMKEAVDGAFFLSA